MDIRSVQELAWQNKKAKGFNLTDVPLEFGLLTAEIGEAFTAWRKKLPDFGEELADVFIFLASIAEMTGIDLSAEVQRKLEKNAGRGYELSRREAGDEPALPDRLDGLRVVVLPDEGDGPAGRNSVQDH